MVRCLLQAAHILWERRLDVVNNTVDTNGPSLKAGVLILVALKDLIRNALLAETLSKTEAAKASSGDEDVHVVLGFVVRWEGRGVFLLAQMFGMEPF